MNKRPRLLLGGFLVAAVLGAWRPALAQVEIGQTEITVAGEEVVTVPALCTLYSLTGQKAPLSLGCPPQPVRYIFATFPNDGNLLSVVWADLACGWIADSAGLPGSKVYLAWLADSDPTSDPESRFEKASATTWYTLPSGKIVAIGWDDLTDGQLEWGIGEDATGSAITAPFAAWTNVKRDGTQRSAADGHCNNWTDNQFTPATKYDECDYATHPTEVGFAGSTSSTATTFGWTEGGSLCCDDNPGGTDPKPNQQARVICVQQVLP